MAVDDLKTVDLSHCLDGKMTKQAAGCRYWMVCDQIVVVVESDLEEEGIAETCGELKASLITD